MAGVLDLWSKWEVQILMLVSFALQLFLLLLAGLRRRNIPPVLRIIIWLMYLSADSIALYILGHLSFGSSKQAGEFMALWASFLLVHLGGQDTITAYAMEDNNLWLRHLFTLAVQAAGAAYVLYKHIPSSEGWLLAAAILMLAIGIVKYAERVWSLKTANLQSVSRFLDGVKILRQQVSPPHPHALLDDEVVLQGAHDLLYICMGQFVDYRVWPSQLQCDALNLFDEHNKMYELVEMQLSLMYDVFYTKAVVAHTRRGLCIRAASLLGTATACVLFQLSKHGGDTVDAAVTQVLLVGACLLEVASVLVTLMSTWTCAALKAKGRHRLHRLLVSLRRLVKAARIRRWSGSIGQHNLVDSSGGESTSLGSRVFSFLAHGNSTISPEAKELVLEEICRMVQACEGNEDVMRSYRGHQVQVQVQQMGTSEVLEYIKTEIEFDESILIWHFTTDVFLYFYEQQEQKNVELVEATKAVSNYMVSLFVEHPHMLPSPVRSRLYDSTKQKLGAIQKQGTLWKEYSKGPLFETIRDKGQLLRPWDEHGKPRSTGYPPLDALPETLVPAARLASDLLLLQMESVDMTEVLQAVFRVWVEKLSYAAHHCSRDSHARQLSNGGGELVTVVWLLASAVLKSQNYAHGRFRRRAIEFFDSRRATEIQRPRLCDVLTLCCSPCCLFCFGPCCCCCAGLRRRLGITD